jgi:hypothetical protein
MSGRRQRPSTPNVFLSPHPTPIASSEPTINFRASIAESRSATGHDVQKRTGSGCTPGDAEQEARKSASIRLARLLLNDCTGEFSGRTKMTNAHTIAGGMSGWRCWRAACALKLRSTREGHRTNPSGASAAPSALPAAISACTAAGPNSIRSIPDMLSLEHVPACSFRGNSWHDGCW